MQASTNPTIPSNNENVPQIEGLIHQPVPGDGHCLFHAVALYLGRDQALLRIIAASYITSHLNEFREIIKGMHPDRTPEDYLEAIRSGKEWGDNLEIEALMRGLKRPIVVIQPTGSIRAGLDLDRFVGEPIFVYYNGHNHYDAYVLTDEWRNRGREILSQLTHISARYQVVPQSNTINTVSHSDTVATYQSLSHNDQIILTNTFSKYYLVQVMSDMDGRFKDDRFFAAVVEQLKDQIKFSKLAVGTFKTQVLKHIKKYCSAASYNDCQQIISNRQDVNKEIIQAVCRILKAVVVVISDEGAPIVVKEEKYKHALFFKFQKGFYNVLVLKPSYHHMPEEIQSLINISASLPMISEYKSADKDDFIEKQQIIDRSNRTFNPISNAIKEAVNAKSGFDLVKLLFRSDDFDLVKLLLGPVVPTKSALSSYKLKIWENQLCLAQIALEHIMLIHQGKFEEAVFANKDAVLNNLYHKTKLPIETRLAQLEEQRASNRIATLKSKADEIIRSGELSDLKINEVLDNAEDLTLKNEITEYKQKLQTFKKQYETQQDNFNQFKKYLEAARKAASEKFQGIIGNYFNLDLKDVPASVLLLIDTKSYRQFLDSILQKHIRIEEDGKGHGNGAAYLIQDFDLLASTQGIERNQAFTIIDREFNEFESNLGIRLQETIKSLLKEDYDWYKRCFTWLSPLYAEEITTIVLRNEFSVQYHKKVEIYFQQYLESYKKWLVLSLKKWGLKKSDINITNIVKNLIAHVVKLKINMLEESKIFNQDKQKAENTFREKATEWLKSTAQGKQHLIKVGRRRDVDKYVQELIDQNSSEIKQGWLRDQSTGDTLLHQTIQYFFEAFNSNEHIKVKRIHKIIKLLFAHNANIFMLNSKGEVACDLIAIKKTLEQPIKTRMEQFDGKMTELFTQSMWRVQQLLWDLLYSQALNLQVYNQVPQLYLDDLKAYLKEKLNWKTILTNQEITDRLFVIVVGFLKVLNDSRSNVNSDKLLNQYVTDTIMPQIKSIEPDLYNALEVTRNVIETKKGKQWLVLDDSNQAIISIEQQAQLQRVEHEKNEALQMLRKKEAQSAIEIELANKQAARNKAKLRKSRAEVKQLKAVLKKQGDQFETVKALLTQNEQPVLPSASSHVQTLGIFASSQSVETNVSSRAKITHNP